MVSTRGRPLSGNDFLVRMTTLHPIVSAVTDRILERSRHTQRAYFELIARQRESGVRAFNNMDKQIQTFCEEQKLPA